ncbi:hypothetical protein OY671_004414 [Metschnikowia pulcherrima]|nr:hypothetical protein OY671_004414 [Metschnikowia pulcherrima]
MAEPAKERRHAFRSFKERVDSMKIEPSRKLNTRAHDYVETSHFLATLEHWKEVNISGDFTEFVREVEPFCQTLAQILHHQAKIFASLHSHIEKNDVHSIQPLLELMSQFIHDLGPDFMPFYNSFLHLIVTLAQQTSPNDAQNMRNTSNVLEWCFNTLAFSFKYLARVLTEDLKPTFTELMPVLQMTKQTYVSRFCAEALSFLVKKSRPEPLKEIVQFSFNEQDDLHTRNKFFCESLVTLFSEAMKNTSETFHSKSGTLFSVLLENALAEDVQKCGCIGALCDIMLQVSKHGSAQACAKFYNTCIAHLQKVVLSTKQPRLLEDVLKVLITMCYSESGKKIQDWPAVFSVIELLLQKARSLGGAQQDYSREFLALLAHLFATIVRNCDTEHMSNHCEYLAGFLATIDDNRYFLSFYELAYTNAPEKMATFGAVRSLQNVINNAKSESQLISLAQKLSKLEKSATSEIVLPSFLTSQLLEMMERDFKEPFCHQVLQALFWKLKLLAFAPDGGSDSATPVRILQSLADRSLPQSPFLHDVLGTSMGVAVLLSKPACTEATEIYTLIQNCLEPCRGSIDFLTGATRFLEKHSAAVSSLLAADRDQICLVLAQNFSLPDRHVRVKTATFLAKLYQVAALPVPFVISQIKIIDEAPLTIANANDVKMRIRNVITEFAAMKDRTTNDKIQLSSYVVGLLSNNFQPCWLAVYESLPQLTESGCSDYLWKVLMAFLQYDFDHQTAPYTGEDEFADTTQASLGFDVLDEKLAASINAAAESILLTDSDSLVALVDTAQNSSTRRAYNPQLRSRIIKAMQAITYVVESHGAEFIELITALHGSESSANDSWTNKDKLAVVSVCARFKKMQKIAGNERLFELVLENLSSKQTNVQQESLEVLFAWNKPQINKYKDNLKNLLEDKLFRDELQALVNKNGDSKIEDGDAPAVIPIVLRILYGRAKGAANNNSKNGRKFAIATILPNLPDMHVEQFLDILSQQLNFRPFFETKQLPEPTKKELNSMVGYLNMLFEVYNGLGYKFAHVLRHTIQPLTFTLLSGQKVLDSENEDELTMKIARTVRSLGFKCLDHLFKITASTYELSDEGDLIFEQIVAPRLPRFAQENAQQPSALMNTILGWVNSPRLVPFLYLHDHAAVRAVMELAANPHTKDSVQQAILDFAISAFTRKDVTDDSYYTLLALIVDGMLSVLPNIIEVTLDKDINARAATLLLLIIEGGYVQETATKRALVQACASAIRKPPAQIGASDRVSLLLSLVSILDGFECAFDDIRQLFDVCSSAFRSYKDRNVREALVQIFGVIGSQFSEFALVADLLADLNAFSAKRMVEPDFERRLSAFGKINESLYSQLSPQQWLPIVQACLFFINDPDEIAIRSNASYTLTRYLDGLTGKPEEETAAYVKMFNSVVVPHLRTGLKKESDEIKDQYIHVLAAAVQNHLFFPEFESMKVLLAEDPDEDFFKNFTHIQLKCKQQAIRSLVDVRTEISPDCIHHYLLPMTESYTVCEGDKMRAILDDTHATWASLVSRLRWDHFRSLFRKHIQAAARAEENERRDRIRLVIFISQGMLTSFRAQREGRVDEAFAYFPEDLAKTEQFIMREFFEPIMEVVRIRDDETVVDRTLLVEAAVNCLLCVSDEQTESAISGTLTSTCQALRSRYQPTRDSVRKTLCKVTKIVGAKYFKFVVQELKTALSRGAQIHVLSYTTHAVLAAIRDSLQPGDLDDSAPLIVDIIMEDIFGAAGQDKDAEDYVSSMREVKSKKSFDTGEVLCTNISLSSFRYIVEPIKMLLKVNIPLRTRRKLDDLLVKYSHGILFNPCAATRDVLVLCYELHQQSTSVEFFSRKYTAPTEAEEHFLVKVNAKPTHMNVDKSQVLFALQKLCFELMRSALGKNPQLMTAANLDGFIPLMQASMEAEDEGLLVALYRVLDLIVKLEFDESRDAFFTDSATRAFSIIQNLASTSSELAQTCLRYLATIVRHKPAVKLSDSALMYVLIRILPDLEEPDQQGLAFNFLKAVLYQHIMLPEVYEVMEKVSSIMVVNHNKAIRDMARALYFQFLMEYEQGPAKLEKAFKFLVNNLGYPTQSGRESVMELMHSVILKSSETLLAQLATSFFVGLANVAVSDDISKCREMASALIARLFKKAPKERPAMENFTLSWMVQDSNNLLRRCGLLVYKVYLSVFGFGSHEKLDSAAFGLVETVIGQARLGADTDTDWEDVYMGMSVFSGMCNALGEQVLTPKFEPIWRHVLDTILYPHTWVRLLSARLVGVLLGNLDKVTFTLTPEQLQTVCYRLLRQLGAPVVAPELGAQIVKNMIQIATKWQNEQTPFYVIEKAGEDAEPDANEEGRFEPDAEVEQPKYASAIDFVLARICSLMRQDTRSDKNLTARKAAIQLGAVIAQLVDEEKVVDVSRQLLFGMYYILEQDAYSDAENDVLNMAKESVKALEDRLGVTKFIEVHTSVRKSVDQKRQERRVKRAQLAITAPDVAARRKMKKHGNFREKRKHRKDDNGYYRAKRTKKNQA